MNQPTILKIIRCFALTRQVIHFYWVYTEGDDPNGETSIENLQRIIERIIRLTIRKVSVLEPMTFLRGTIERYKDRIEILIPIGQGRLWERFAVAKEFCHALGDGPDEYSVEALQTISDLKRYSTPGSILLDGTSSVVRAEQLAELMALELIYPHEYRFSDRERRDAGEPLASIAERRGVPLTWVETALSPYLEACDAIWKALPDTDMAKTLPPLD